MPHGSRCTVPGPPESLTVDGTASRNVTGRKPGARGSLILPFITNLVGGVVVRDQEFLSIGGLPLGHRLRPTARTHPAPRD